MPRSTLLFLFNAAEEQNKCNNCVAVGIVVDMHDTIYCGQFYVKTGLNVK